VNATSASFASSAVGAVSATEPSLPARALGNVLAIAATSCLVVVSVVLFGLGGWEYYRAPLGTRGYLPEHLLLRPSGPVGLTLGVAGVVSMLMTLPYAVRKRWRALARIGTMKQWIEVHNFVGIVGPVLITLHTSFKFNGLISVGYWLMMTVWASGFIGRYLYVRIPKTIRGVELSYSQVGENLARIQQQLESRPLPPAVQQELHDFDLAVAPARGGAPGAMDLFFGELRVRARLMLLRRHLREANIDVEAITSVVDRAAERATLARRLVHLERTRHLFELWHVFHRPLVYGLFVIVVLHVAIALYFGYARLP
jgi:cytochrome b561